MSSRTDKTDTLKAKLLEALEKSLGVVTSACKNADIHRATHYEWLKIDPDYKEKVNEIENVALDFVESKLHKQIEKGVPVSTIFYLKCKGKKRGYIDRVEIEHSGKIEHESETFKDFIKRQKEINDLK